MGCARVPLLVHGARTVGKETGDIRRLWAACDLLEVLSAADGERGEKGGWRKRASRLDGLEPPLPGRQPGGRSCLRSGSDSTSCDHSSSQLLNEYHSLLFYLSREARRRHPRRELQCKAEGILLAAAGDERTLAQHQKGQRSRLQRREQQTETTRAPEAMNGQKMTMTGGWWFVGQRSL